MKQVKIDFNFHPLKIIHGLGPVGNVPPSQSYDATQNIWLPDYTLANLVLQEKVVLHDPDGVIPDGSIADKLASMSVYEVVDGVETLITPENTGYTVTTTGANAGQIVVRKNSEVSSPITVRVKGKYYDTRTQQTLEFYDSYLIPCANATTLQDAEIDVPTESIFDPFHDTPTLTVTAAHRIGTTKTPYDAGHLHFVWQRVAQDGTVAEITGLNDEDFPFTISGQCNETLTIDRELMGNVCAIRMYAVYNPVEAVFNITESTPRVDFGMRRRLPAYSYDAIGSTSNINPGTKYLAAKAVVKDSQGVIENPETQLSLLWYTAAGSNAPTTLVYDQCAHGVTAMIPTDKMNTVYGMVYALDVKDLGALLPITDSTGKVLTDADGAIIVGH